MSEDTQNTETQFKTGQTVTISRGKLRGQQATIVGVHAPSRTLAVETSEGLISTTFSNVKEPAEPTATKSQVEAALDLAGIADDDCSTFMAVLADKIPGWS